MKKGMISMVLAAVLLAVLAGCAQRTAESDNTAVNIYRLSQSGRQTLVRSISWEDTKTLSTLADQWNELLNSNTKPTGHVAFEYRVEFLNYNSDGSPADSDSMDIGFDNGFVVGNSENFSGEPVSMAKCSMTQEEFLALAE